MTTARPDTWMAFYVGDYVTNTLHLTTRQHGGYLLLILAAWKGKGYLPGSDAGLQAITKLSAQQWRADGEILKAFLTRSGDDWVHERVLHEWSEAVRISGVKSDAGKAGAERRWSGRRNAGANGSGMADASQEHRQTDAPLPEPVQIPDRPAAAAPSASPRGVVDQAFNGWQALATKYGWPDAQFLTPTRRFKMDAVLGICGGLPGWKAALVVAATDAKFLKTADDQWQRWFNFDWMIDIDNFAKLMEGRYAERHNPNDRTDSGAPSVSDGVAAAFSRRYPAAG